MDDPAAGEIAVQDAGRLGAALAAFHALEPIDRARIHAVCRSFGSPRLAGCSDGFAPTSQPAVDALVRELICAPARRLRAARLPSRRRASEKRDRHRSRRRAHRRRGSGHRTCGGRHRELSGRPPLSAAWRTAHRRHARRSRACVSRSATGRCGPLPAHASLQWHTAAALLVERIFRAVTRVRPLGLLHMPELLCDARALLTERHP